MQLTAYLFNPEIPARFNKPNTVRNTVMWNKPLIIYQGADNILDVVVNDFDMQPLPVNIYRFKFKVKNNKDDVVLVKEMKFKEGATNRLSLEIMENDVSTWSLGMYTWGISVTDDLNRERPMYLELNGDAESTFQLRRWFAGS